MSDLKIYNNGENKVLMSAGDRIIRQPYEFGNAFQNGAGLNNYIEAQNLGLPSNVYTVLAWSSVNSNVGTAGAIGCAANITLSTDRHMSLINRGLGAQASVIAPDQNISQNLTIAGNATLMGCVKSGTDYNFYVNSSTSQILGVVNQSAILNKLIISAILAHTTSSGTSIFGYANPISKNSRVIIFSRAITDSEYRFYYNNKLGSNLQSREGVEIDLLCDFAEILDFSILQDGSDLRVGCRDYSGFNRHGQIMNLPVGSIEDQLAFANANLFVPFIQ